MTSLLREEMPVPMPDSASATITSCPASAAARATARPTTPAPTTRTCISPPLPGSALDRQADIVLGHRAHRGGRARHVIELGELALAIEGVVAGIEMKQLRHPPGEALRLPDPPQAGRRIALDEIAAAGAIEFGERAREHLDVGQREIHALGAGRRLDMGGIAGEKQPAILHRLDHEAAHGGDALLQHLAFHERPGAGEPHVQLLPDARIGPVLDVLVGSALQVKPRQARRAHGVKREAAIVIGIDQLVLGRGRLRQDADPAERVLAVVRRQRGSRNARATNAVEAVAAADEVAGELLVPAAVPETDLRRVACEIVYADVDRLEQDRSAVGQPPRDQVLYHLLLAVDGHALPDQLAEIDVVQGAAEGEIDPVVKHGFALHALADAGLGEEVARPLLDQAGADAALDIVAAAALQDHRLDALEVQEMGEHQPGRSSADDTDLRAHGALPRYRSVGATGSTGHRREGTTAY